MIKDNAVPAIPIVATGAQALKANVRAEAVDDSKATVQHEEEKFTSIWLKACIADTYEYLHNYTTV